MHSHEYPARPSRALKLLSALATLLVLGALIIASRFVSPWTQIAAAGDKATANAVVKANAFLETLDAKQREKALLDFDSAKKPSWSNLPVTFVPRNGLALGELTKPQRAAALELVAAVLSKEGYQKAIDIMNADDQLVKDKDNKMKFGTEHFYIALFGAPSSTKPWMMQFGGHHLGINVTMMGKDAVVTPTHTGAQPDSFQRDGKTVRPLGQENDLAFKLVNMLNAEQKKQVVLGAKPKNLVLGPKEDNKKSDPEGLKCSALDKAQRAVLMDLVAQWINMLPTDAAARRKAEIEKKLDDTHFVWYGPTTNGSAAYYKIQGPNVHIEYAPQGGVSHIHTIIRDPSNDYGKELIKR